MWLMYENPDIKFEGLSLRFMDIRKRVYDIQENKSFKSQLVCIPTTSGTGSEVTPFSVVTDSEIHQKFPLADYVLTPSMVRGLDPYSSHLLPSFSLIELVHILLPPPLLPPPPLPPPIFLILLFSYL